MPIMKHPNGKDHANVGPHQVEQCKAEGYKECDQEQGAKAMEAAGKKAEKPEKAEG